MSGGTIVCGVDDSQGARDALQLAAAIRERLGLRLVVAHVAKQGKAGSTGEVGQWRRADQLLARVLAQTVVPAPIERRLALGDRAGRLAEIAAEEGADIIILGSPSERRMGWRWRSTLARELESATSCPLVVAPPQSRRRSGVRLARAEGLQPG